MVTSPFANYSTLYFYLLKVGFVGRNLVYSILCDMTQDDGQQGCHPCFPLNRVHKYVYVSHNNLRECPYSNALPTLWTSIFTMKEKFNIIKEYDSSENATDRQSRIEWWDQEALRGTKVMVAGAGAIGNETLKNLALLGVGYVFIVDFDLTAWVATIGLSSWIYHFMSSNWFDNLYLTIRSSSWLKSTFWFDDASQKGFFHLQKYLLTFPTFFRSFNSISSKYICLHVLHFLNYVLS